MAKIGIDFGTTNSLMVAYDKDKHKFQFFNYKHKQPIPTSSTIWYHDNNIIVGNEAREKIHKLSNIEGNHFEKSIKLHLGKNYNSNIFGKSIPAYKIAGEIIKHLKKVAIDDYRAIVGHVDLNTAVFTVPINYSGQARQDLRKSANEAGIEVTTFIHEPFAAIVGYYFSKEQNSYNAVIESLNTLDGNYFLIFDWGGGTLDITVVHIKNGKMYEIGTSELTNVAGDKFDEDIALLVWNRFLDTNGSKYSDEYLEKIRRLKWDKLIAVAEQCKIQLSTNEQTEFIIDYITPSERIDEIITRYDFEFILQNSLDAAINRIDAALKESGINDIDISQVLLTGGTCYIPAVQKRMRDKFGHRVKTVKDADLLIAQGAAVISEMGWLPYLTKDVLIQLSDDSYWPLFEHEMPIASGCEATRSETFVCVDQRNKTAKVIICEGIGQKSDKNLGIINVPILGHNLFGDDIQIDSTLDKDIVLNVSAYSKMVHGPKQPIEEYSIRKSVKIHQLCFGLDYKE